MDRIEAAAHIEAEQKKRLEPLKLDMSRYKARKVSNHDHAKKVALAEDIRKAWGIPIPRLMKAIKEKGYQFILETFHEVQKSGARNPPALFNWKVKNCKVDLKEAQLK